MNQPDPTVTLLDNLYLKNQMRYKIDEKMNTFENFDWTNFSTLDRA